jgi:type 1 fimbriae regulatory protein FimB
MIVINERADHDGLVLTIFNGVGHHGLRVSELIDLRLKDLDLGSARLYVRRKKGSLSTHQPIEGDELRALRAWLREREQRSDARSSYLFLSERGPMTRQAVNYLVAETGKCARLRFHVHPHMLRHSTGYYLANRNYDTRLVQDYLGHKNIAHSCPAYLFHCQDVNRT